MWVNFLLHEIFKLPGQHTAYTIGNRVGYCITCYNVTQYLVYFPGSFAVQVNSYLITLKKKKKKCKIEWQIPLFKMFGVWVGLLVLPLKHSA